MRPISPYFGNIPFPMEEEYYQNQLKMLLEKVAQGVTIKTAEDIKGYAPSDVKTRLENIFHKKCAFCESDTKAGAVYYTEVLAKSEMGERSIRFYGLNDWEKREELIIARKKVIKTVEERVKRAVDRYAKIKYKEVLYDDLFNIQTDLSLSIAQSWDAESLNSEPYIGVITACLKNFKDFFLPPFVHSPYEAVLQEIMLQIDKDMEIK